MLKEHFCQVTTWFYTLGLDIRRSEHTLEPMYEVMTTNMASRQL